MINKNNLNNNQIDKINNFVKEIKRWNGLDLIAKSTVNDIWKFHINEALSIDFLLYNTKLPIIDFGAGSGVIAYVLNVLNIPVECVERNSSKMLFIQKICKIKCSSVIEHDEYVSIVRGVDKIINLLKILKNAKELILFKSINYQDEIERAFKEYVFEYSTYNREVPGVVLHIFNIRKI